MLTILLSKRFCTYYYNEFDQFGVQDFCENFQPFFQPLSKLSPHSSNKFKKISQSLQSSAREHLKTMFCSKIVISCLLILFYIIDTYITSFVNLIQPKKPILTYGITMLMHNKVVCFIFITSHTFH